MKEISNLEILEIREKIEHFFAKAEYHDLEQLRDNTLDVLRGLKLPILNSMNSQRLNQMARSIKTIISNFLRRTREGFKNYSRCLACKTALRIILFSFASTIGIAITAINTQFNGVVDLLSKFFEQSTQSITNFLRNNGFQIAAYNLFDLNDLIESLCVAYGWC